MRATTAPPLVARLGLAMWLSILTVSIVVHQFPASAQAPCSSPPKQPSTNGAAWAVGASLNVVINPNDFTPEQRAAIQAAFTSWQNVNGSYPGNSSGVSFSFSTGTSKPPGNNVFYVERGPTNTGGATALSFTGSPTSTGNIMTSAVTRVDTTMTRPGAITNLMLHEIGHTFGLGDCLSCPHGSTIMSTYLTDCYCPSFPCDQGAHYNGMRWGCPSLQSPTQCDNDAANQYGSYPPPPGGGGPPCPGVECNEGSGTQIDNCSYGNGCPTGYVNTGSCCQPDYVSPIIIDVDGSGFHLTNASNGVWFDFFGVGRYRNISWISDTSTNAWLALDRNGNGYIEKGAELFGNLTPQPPTSNANGFIALAEYDKPANGGNGDDRIDRRDAVFSALRLWQDTNHNGISEVIELHTLLSLDIKAIDLDYRESRRVDQFGNQFKYRAKVYDTRGASAGRWAWDVFLVSAP
jgi:hypothetical protein